MGPPHRLLLFPLGWVIYRNVDDIAAGEPIRVIGSLALITFFGWLALRPVLSRSAASNMTTEQWRAMGRREVGWWSFWTLVAIGVIAGFAAQYGFRPWALIYVALPALPFVTSAVIYLKADSIADRYARA